MASFLGAKAERRLPRTEEDFAAIADLTRELAPRARDAAPSALDTALDRRAALGIEGIETFTVGDAGDSDCDFNDIQSAVDAAAANGDTLDFIRVARNQTYSNVAVLVAQQDLAIFGGYDSCADNTESGVTTLNGTSSSVIEVRGALLGGFAVTLRDLELRAGTALRGGGLYANTDVRVDLDNVGVRANDATFGGGIAATDGAEVFLMFGTLVENNDAQNGGGIFCLDSTVEIQLGTSVFTNEASGNGGGVYADNCSVTSRAGLVSIFTLGIVDNEAAGQGGGIYATNGSQVELRGTATSLALLGGNDAVNAGGGASLAGGARLDALNASIVENRVTAGTGAGVRLAEGSTLMMDQISTAGCNPGGRCSELSRNASGLSAISASDANVTIQQTFVEGNEGVAGFMLFGGTTTALLEGLVLASNQFTTDTTNGGIIVTPEASLVAAFLTSWGNLDSNSEALIAAQSGGLGLDVELHSSILDEHFGTIIGNHDGATSSILLDCVLGRTEALLGGLGSFTVFAADPKLVFPSNGDFHLKPTSPAIDYCDNVLYAPVDGDIDGEMRGADSLGVPNILGPYDLGADETQSNVLLFMDGFESGDTSAWSATTP